MTQQAETPVKTTKVNKFLQLKVTKKGVLYILVIILIAVAITGIIFQYSNLFVRAQNDIGRLKATVAWQKQQINWLEEYRSYAELRFGSIEAQLIDAQIAKASGSYTDTYKAPTVTIDKVTTFTPDSLKNTGQSLVLIDFTAKNNNPDSTYFTSSYYKMKDSNNYEYQTYSTYDRSPNSSQANVVLPDGRTQTDSLSLSPGETSKGTMVFLLTRPVSNLQFIDTNTGTVKQNITI